MGLIVVSSLAPPLENVKTEPRVPGPIFACVTPAGLEPIVVLQVAMTLEVVRTEEHVLQSTHAHA